MLSINCGKYKLDVSATVIIASLSLLIGSNNVEAQIKSDRTTDTQVQVTDNLSLITGGIQAGNNLFHSFEEFSVPTNQVVNFSHTPSINNIFTRVTGGNISQIDGLIQSQGSANLFLLNPAGIIFGNNAQLNIGGSFIATTSDRILFTDGTEFSAVSPTTPPLLTISLPIGLQYGSNPGEINVLPNYNRTVGNSGLNIKPGHTLALLGGDITIERNSLSGVNSNIEISSIKSGTVGLEPNENGWQFDYQNVSQLGNLELSDRALINASGIVNFQGDVINLATGSGIRNLTDSDGKGGIINLEATDSINLNGGLLLTQVGQIQSNIDQAITESGGDILFQAPKVTLTNGSIISAGTLSEGKGGNITIDATESVQLSNSTSSNPTIISTSTQGKGTGGEITLNTGELTIKDGSQIQALAGEGAGGTITVNANDSVIISGTGILRSRDRTGHLSTTILNSGLVAAAGIKGLPLQLQPKGESGNLVINTSYLKLDDQAEISVSNFGLANGGDITINTANLELDNAGQITANTQSGEGGSINIIASESVIFNNLANISTTAQQNGNGGNILLTADNLVLLESNKISADAQQGSGGNIAIATQGLFVNPNSSITASSDLQQKVGTVKIDTLDSNSKISTQTQERSPLVAADYITTGCTVKHDFSKNRFVNLGRGGLPTNLMQETIIYEMLSDLGNVSNYTLKSVKPTQAQLFNPPTPKLPLTEATAWIINSQGNIELIATKSTPQFGKTSFCQ
ncbi:hypothetical protein NIES4102_16020 [Chondrocystis sp. NIES-4102]|nr:hypothetical protein NIES4102_16020 [Chondrocystis sp. NIES-4102]